MPAVAPGSLVLVTGASGFVASYIVKELLGRGFRVRGTVRSSAKGDALKASLKEHADKFEYVIVEDIKVDGAFTQAAKGVDGIIHTASPQATHVKTSVWEDLINPAVAGTVGALNASKNYPEVQRLVITSSYAAIANPSRGPGAVFTEEDWNTPAVEQAKEQGDKAPVFIAYRTSKLLSEKAAWDFVAKEKPHFDLVTVVPSFATGPASDTVATPAGLDAANKHVFAYLTGATTHTAETAKNGPALPSVDVRDIAIGHVEALIRPEASGKRINLNDKHHFWQELLDVLHDKHPEIVSAFPNATWGVKGAKNPDPQFDADAKISREVLGIKYRSVEDTAVASATSILEAAKKHGWKL